MKRCLIKFYVSGAEVHSKRRYMVVLDYDTPEGLQEMEYKLDRLAYSLARVDGARGEQIAAYYLAVHDPITGALEFHWPARDLSE